MTEQELDLFMRNVLLDAIALDEETNTETIPYTPSLYHQKQIKAMLKNPLRWARNRKQPVWKRALKRVAVILLVISLAFGSLMVVSPTARATFIRWVTEWYETHVTYRYAGDDMVGDLPEYTITELPEGYAEDRDQRIEFGTQTFISYQNGDIDSAITLHYCYMQQGAATIFVLENADSIPVIVNGCEGQIFLSKNLETTRNAITYKRLHHEQDTEDAVHHAFMKIAENITAIDPVSPKTKQFVVTIVNNRVTDMLRMNGRHPAAEYNDEILSGLSSELHTDDLLTEAILKLPEQQRHVIWLKYYHGYSLREISKMLGITLSWAQKIDQRAKKQLEILYKEGGGEF